jgi:glycosyltransferase involved in cell wall biosynthesis
MEPGTGRLVDELHRAFPRTTHSVFHTYCTSFAERDAVFLPKILSLPNGLTKWKGCRRSLRLVAERSDILLVQLPFDSPLALLGLDRPTLYHACADLRTVAKSSRFRGPLRVAAYFAAAGIDAIYGRLVNAKSARLVTNGEKLFAKYGKPAGKWVVSSSISESEISSVARRRPSNAPFRIIYVGFLRRQKGIDVLIEAFARLQKEIPEAELHIVGEADLLEQAAVRDLFAQIGEGQRSSAVRLLGHIPFGPDLFQALADADVLALPSLGEGTPRVLIEARAFGCPVVATKVGGIPSMIDHEVDGLLIFPNDVESLQAALLRVAQDLGFRQRLIENGLKRARKHTVEVFAAGIISELDALATLIPCP